MADFGIYGQLQQFGDPVSFSISGELPQFSGNITVNNLDFEVVGELQQFDGDIYTVQGRTFAVAGELPQFEGDIDMAQGQSFAIAGTFKQFSGSITIDQERQFAIAGTLKQFEGSIVTHATSDFAIAGTLPQFGGDIRFAGTVKVVAVNPALRGVTEYSNYDFNSFFEYGGKYYGVTSAGIYLLEGTTDAGTAISASLEGGRGHLGAAERSTITDVFAQTSTNGTLSLNLKADNATTGQTYTVTGDGTLRNRRWKCALGVQGTEWQWKISNSAGSTLPLQRLEFLVEQSSRR